MKVSSRVKIQKSYRGAQVSIPSGFLATPLAIPYPTDLLYYVSSRGQVHWLAVLFGAALTFEDDTVTLLRGRVLVTSSATLRPYSLRGKQKI